MTVRRGPISRSVAAALRAAPPLPRDRAAVELVKAYAVLLDDAAELHGAAVAAVKTWDREDTIGRAHVSKLADALAAREVVSDLGPKLLAALAALHLTAAARGKVEGKAPRDPVADELAALRAEHGNRPGVDRAAAVDATAP